MFLDPDKSFTVFSSRGKLVQCDNALTAALNSALSIGCSAEDGTVIVSFKNISPLLVKKKYHKVVPVCPSIGVTYSGLQPDFRVQLALAQRIAQDYFDVYSRFPSIDVFIAEFSLSIQEYTQRSALRPFGTFLIFAGASKSGPCCYQMDPSGSFQMVRTTAGGAGYDEANKFMQRRRELVDDNIVNALTALREYTGKELGPEDVSIGVFRAGTGLFTVYDEGAIQEVFDSLRL